MAVTVDLRIATTTSLRHGYVHGISDPDSPATAAALYASAMALGAKNWRVSDPRHTRFLAPSGIELTYVLFDLFAGYDPAVEPWSPNFTAWDRYVADVVQQNLTNGSPITFFDIWGEPRITTTNTAQVLETYRRTNALIRAMDPNARIVAPSLAGFDEKALAAFLDDAVNAGQTYDAICWHSFSDPRALLAHVQRARDLIAARPSLGTPELHINEYMNSEQHLVPAFNVAWLSVLEASGVDVANRACWDAVDGQGTYIDCWAGIEGVYMRDGVTPQPAYHVLQPYGRLSTTRYAAQSGNVLVPLLAGRDDGSGELRVLTGYVGAPASDGVRVTLTIQGITNASNVLYEVDRIPSVDANLEAKPLPAPLHGPAGDAGVVSGAVTLDLGCIPRGAAAVVRLSTPNAGGPTRTAPTATSHRRPPPTRVPPRL